MRQRIRKAAAVLLVFVMMAAAAFPALADGDVIEAGQYVGPGGVLAKGAGYAASYTGGVTNIYYNNENEAAAQANRLQAGIRNTVGDGKEAVSAGIYSAPYSKAAVSQADAQKQAERKALVDAANAAIAGQTFISENGTGITPGQYVGPGGSTSVRNNALSNSAIISKNAAHKFS